MTDTAKPTPSAPPESAPLTAHRAFSLVPATAIAALLLVAMLFIGGGAPQRAPEGIPDPGLLTGWGLAALSLLNDLLTVVVVAGLLMPVLSTARVGTGQTIGRLSGVRAAGKLCIVWLAVLALLAWFTMSDIYAEPLFEVQGSEVRGFVEQSDQVLAIVVQFAIVAVLAAVTPFVRTFGQALATVGLGLLTLAPQIVTGHSASSGSHDLALAMLAVHVVPVVVWAAGVLSLWLFLGAKPGKRELAAQRFSMIAGPVMVIVGVSGLVSSLVRFQSPLEFFTTGYGLVSLAKAALLLAIGLTGLQLRRQLHAGIGSWQGFAKVAAFETTLMAATFGAAVALSRTPPPVGEVLLTPGEVLIGVPMPPAPTTERILWSLTPSGLGLVLLTFGIVGYGTALWTLHRRGDKWPIWRTLAWFFGLAVTGYATIGGIGVYSHVLFSAHMVSHMLLAMMAPIFLVLGAPITLLLRALPGGPTPQIDGPRQVLSFIMRTWIFRLWSNPFFVVGVFLVSLYGVYFTSFFDKVMFNHLGHTWMQLHFLISGYLLWELIIGTDPLPRRLSYPIRLVVLMLLAPFHAFFAISVMNSTKVIGQPFYELLNRSYRTDLLADQNYAGAFVWAFGELPTLITVLAMLGLWFASERRQAERFDRREERAGADSELAEYNRRLAAAAAADRPTPSGGSHSTPDSDPASDPASTD